MMRSIGFGMGITGAEIEERMAMSGDELVDILNTLLDMGFVETASMKDHVTSADYATEIYEINPSYASDLRTAMKRN
jgi:hypothetical protein